MREGANLLLLLELLFHSTRKNLRGSGMWALNVESLKVQGSSFNALAQKKNYVPYSNENVSRYVRNEFDMEVVYSAKATKNAPNRPT